MAELPQDLSPLQIGTKGHFDGRAFTLIGRLRLHWQDGSWSEWCADFGQGKIGWVAEAMGFYMVSFEQKAAELDGMHDAPAAGTRLKIAGDSWLVNDVKRAKCIAAEGELPFAVQAGAERVGVDLTGPQGNFGSIEITAAGNTFFKGHYAQFEELNFTELRKVPGWDEHAAITRNQSAATNCPNCAAPVNIRAEGLTMSAVCGSCGTILDSSQPTLAAIGKVVKTTLRLRPIIPIGTRGLFLGDTWEVIGFMRRKDRWVFWEEFLLFNPWLGFRFLVTFRGHWSFVRILPGHHTNEQWDGERFAMFAREEVTTTDVLGEFYWRVKVGERVQLTDYISAPRVLSSEFSKQLNEVAWSGGEYVDYREVQRAFFRDGSKLPSPSGSYLNAPNPHLQKWREARLTFFFVLAAYVLIQICCLGYDYKTELLKMKTEYLKSNADQIIQLGSPFHVAETSALHISAEASAIPMGGYLALKGALVNAETQSTIPLMLPMTNYNNSSSEQRHDVTLPAVPAGKYYFRFEPDASPLVTQAPIQLSATRGGLFWSNFWLGLIPIALWPLWLLIRSSSFEKQRWMESDFSSYTSSDSDDGADTDSDD